MTITQPSTLRTYLQELIDSGNLQALWADESAWEGTFTWHREGETTDTSAELTAGIGPLHVQLMRVQPSDVGEGWHEQRAPVAVQVLQGMLEIRTGVRVSGECVATSMILDLPASGSFEFVPNSGELYRARALDTPCFIVAIYGAAADTVPPPYVRTRPLSLTEIEDLRLAFGDLLVWSR